MRVPKTMHSSHELNTASLPQYIYILQACEHCTRCRVFSHFPHSTSRVVLQITLVLSWLLSSLWNIPLHYCCRDQEFNSTQSRASSIHKGWVNSAVSRWVVGNLRLNIWYICIGRSEFPAFKMKQTQQTDWLADPPPYTVIPSLYKFDESLKLKWGPFIFFSGI